ncbi:HAD-IA family hydrolase [Oleiagrimonas sp. C23AA]|uniref:HAD-IA family hydrolase n=1 Tax=Oleiagrimonas sp. C23AA TaxID=2719047 RepID=UPI00141EFDDC|nr:HAD-IA family hydrolase [Oleiagrimonas sp. C23AA]NII10090.1 HAD-IA family hydrolase [Oleiagrimonas sp. C23AA]
MKSLLIDLLICDCDGVIVDSEILAERAWRTCLARYVSAEAYEPALAGTFGMTSTVLGERLRRCFGEALPDDFAEQVHREWETAVSGELAAIDGVREALCAIDLPLAVASNSWTHQVEHALQRADLVERVGGRVFAADMVQNPKPAPDVYLLAAETLGVAPERCLVVEDSATGARAALAAGMQVLGFVGASHIPEGHAQALRELGVRDIVTHMRHLPQIVQALCEPATA